MFYRYHLFFCTNDRQDGSACCARHNARDARNYLKQRCKEAGIHQEGGVRINSAGCMGRCDQGPVIAVYPEGIWYSYVDQEDLDEILQSHLLKGQPVQRLRIPAG
ncbi:MAG: NAD(P)H-dependent oxidoreductase subunit E [Gammaproteobacteria bacterium SHHR-1]|uniref:(2Fe-2S) ferredoxin domain-containing protein n=1 Tax=Magnetovirga frankeli TaxID=947516 RepID=UPI001293058F|nr:NAD(P)H-dependent oxidoreductase subunit E [gamma proteobacterium SS-5]